MILTTNHCLAHYLLSAVMPIIIVDCSSKRMTHAQSFSHIYLHPQTSLKSSFQQPTLVFHGEFTQALVLSHPDSRCQNPASPPFVLLLLRIYPLPRGERELQTKVAVTAGSQTSAYYIDYPPPTPRVSFLFTHDNDFDLTCILHRQYTTT